MNLPKQLFHWLKQRQSKLCHRQLLVLTGQEQWTINTADTLLGDHDFQNTLWVGDTQSEYQNINIKNYRSKLGHEYDFVVLNCFSGFRANAAMALSGTIKAKGLMILLCPDIDLWPTYDDPEKINRISFGYNQQKINSQFFRYLSSAFTEDHFVAVCTKDQFSGSVAIAEKMSVTHNFDQQNQAVEGIIRVALGHRNRPLVLTADRGRGKSSALGIAAAELMKQYSKTIWVTALHLDNTEQIFGHALRMLPMASATKSNITFQGSSLNFKPIDQLLNSKESTNLLLVDEASSLPIHILIKLANKYPRIVFSSTIHGYEGSGRGFEMRFIKQLSQLRPDFKRMQMAQPIRWYQHDTLEQFWFKTMFQNVQQDSKNIDSDSQPISYRHISKTQLFNNKKLLADVFRLLINAHYQTSQDDLQRLLDAPEIECFIMTRGNTLLGVVQTVEEGGNYFDELAENIADCSRRVKGHLVAQNIASSYNTEPFLLSKQWRISRIAIEPEHQRKGLGKQLIDYVEQQAKQQDINFLSASFGCNADILRFWYRSEFILAKLSSKPEVSSGEHSGICIKPLTNEALHLSDSIHCEFYQELLFQMDKNFRTISEQLLIQTLQLEPNANSEASDSVQIIKQFALGKRAYSTCKRLLKEYLIGNATCLLKLATQEKHILVGALLQNLIDKELCEKFDLSGKKQIEQILRVSFKKILTG
ncbi:GNAT family N-acetyltransferase [uncultured Paraglaciecola sp.]|uniref:tRNA(Met) cytidine acetyltransferase TmcA n=1 Tax=uncultured Paraglaciecola sp. TaxID=1765024 RepID=UPI0025E2961C|nr:GNAT family N-acetyltransferase [uncultured Paraglaciecola sp.]